MQLPLDGAELAEFGPVVVRAPYARGAPKRAR